MKKNMLVVFALMIFSILPKNVFALEGAICKIYDSGSEKVLSSDKDKFENSLKQKVQKLNSENIHYDNGNSFLTYGYNYKINIVRTETIESKDKQEMVDISSLFDSEEEAYKYFDDIVLDSPYLKGKYFIDNIKFSNIINGEVQEKKCLSLDCRNEIDNLEKMLSDNQKLNYQIKINDILTGEKIKVDYKEGEKVKYFDTENEANLFAKNYVPKLDGYSFVGNEVVLDNVSVKVLKTYFELKGKDTFDSEEEAKALLEEFKKEYPGASGTVDRIDNGYSTENGTFEFSNKEDALNKISDITKDTDFEKTTASLREGVKNTFEEDIYGEYSTRDEALNAIDELEKNGYVVDGNIEEVKSGTNGNVLSGTKKPSASRYEFPINDTNFVLIKQGSGHYVVWTEYELTEEEKDVFVRSYNSVNSGDSKFDGSTTNITKNEISWIYGFGAHDLSYIGTNWGTYTFAKNDTTIILTCNADRVSHVIQGYATPKIKYILTGTKYKEEKVWYVDYTKTIYYFLYKINASALVEESLVKYKVVSNFERVGKEAILIYSVDTTVDYFKYKLSYEKYVLVSTDIYYIDWVIEKCENLYGKGGEVEEIPPKTGVEVNLFVRFLVIVLSMILLFRNI